MAMRGAGTTPGGKSRTYGARRFCLYISLKTYCILELPDGTSVGNAPAYVLLSKPELELDCLLCCESTVAILPAPPRNTTSKDTMMPSYALSVFRCYTP